MTRSVIDWGLRPYPESLEAMRALRADRHAGKVGDTLVLVEHPPVVTVGVEGDDGSAAISGLPVVAVERGGKVRTTGRASSSDTLSSTYAREDATYEASCMRPRASSSTRSAPSA